MASVPTLIQSPGGCPQTCAGIGASFSCVSRTGSGSLCGFGKFINQNSGEANFRIFLRAHYSGHVVRCVYATSSCTAPISGQWVDYTFDAACAIDPVDCSYSEFAEPTGTAWFDASDCGVENGNSAPSSPGFCPPDFQGQNFSPSTEQFGEYIPISCVLDGAFYVTRIGTVGLTLSTPDTVFDAITRSEDFDESGDCRTICLSIGSYSGQTPGTGSIPVTATSVKTTISMTGLTVAVAYTITANINRYTAGGGGFVDTVQVEINFTADGASDTVDYDVPVNTDFDYEFASIASVVAA